MAKYDIQVTAENCTGCLRCQLGCSELYTKVFNPSAARIRIDVADSDCSISFTEECNACGICADSCFYGALQKMAKESKT